MSESNRVIEKIIAERQRQDAKWGIQNHDPVVWLAILTEELGEAARAILERDMTSCENEVVQIAAVAVAMVESLHRQYNQD